MEEKKPVSFSIANITQLPKWSTKAQFNLPIDQSAHINKVVDVNAFIYDLKTECTSGKVTITGKACIKVLYRDIDGIFNTLSDEAPFTETITDNSLSSDCKVVLNNIQSTNDVSYDEKFLKVNCAFFGNAVCGFNIGVACMQDDIEGVIAKKSQLDALSIVQNVESSCLNANEIVLKEKANKILMCENKLIVQDIIPFDTYIVVQGELNCNVLYETEQDSMLILKIKNEIFPVKCEFEAPFCDKECLLDIDCRIDPSVTNFNTQFDDESATIKMENKLLCNGFVLKQFNVETTDDVYSIDNEVTLNKTDRDFNYKLPPHCFKEDVNGEFALKDNAPVIEDIIGMTNKSATLTKSEINNGQVMLEGIFAGTVIYEEENRQVGSMDVEIPFKIEHKIENEMQMASMNITVQPSSVKLKIKRGTVLDLDVELYVCAHFYYKENRSLLQSIKFGKQLEYGDIAFQIFIAKPNEEMWDLCKRIKISPEKLLQTNKDLSSPCKGGEKVVVYR